MTHELNDHVAQSTSALDLLTRTTETQSTQQTARADVLQRTVSQELSAHHSLLHDTRSSVHKSANDILARIDTHDDTLKNTSSLLNLSNEQLKTRLAMAESVMDQGLSSVGLELEKLKASSMSKDQATLMTGMLAQMMELIESNTTAQKVQASGIIEELDENQNTLSAHHAGTANAQKEAANAMEEQLMESITRLSQLVDEKEQTTDIFDENWQSSEAIIDDMSVILKAAVLRADVLADPSSGNCTECKDKFSSFSKHLKRFNKGFAANTLKLNSTGAEVVEIIGIADQDIDTRIDQTLTTKRKRAIYEAEQHSVYHTVELDCGTISLNYRKRVRKCNCDQTSSSICQSCSQSGTKSGGNGRTAQDQCITSVTFLPKGGQGRPMFVASEHIFKALFSGKTSTFSYLAVNQIILSDSRVFQLVKEGQLHDLRVMLQDGEATLRDHDEGGASLLFVSHH